MDNSEEQSIDEKKLELMDNIRQLENFCKNGSIGRDLKEEVKTVVCKICAEPFLNNRQGRRKHLKCMKHRAKRNIKAYKIVKSSLM